PRLVRSVEILGGLVLCQLMLGAGAWGTSSAFGLNVETAQSGAQIFFATAHVSVGALILATCALLTVQTYRLLIPSLDPSGDRRSPGRGRTGEGRPSVSPLESRELWAQGVSA